MKNRVLVFVSLVLFALTLVPVINLFKLRADQNTARKDLWSKSVLYNVDFLRPYLGLILYPAGISMNPNQVIIGKNNWLYLGDKYEQTITVTRRGATAEDANTAKKIGLEAQSWEKWLKHKGVRQFQLMLGPDKGTIYPEFLPDWAQPAAESATDMLLANVGQELYFDTRPALRAAKSQYSEPLYYQTDTHWNSLGAWVAFREFTKEVGRKEPGLRWLSDNQIRISKASERKGGDLARFLSMSEMLRDSEVSIELDNDRPIEIEQYDFENGRLTASDGYPRGHALLKPLLVKSQNALNQRRVLWLRDSFGEAMAPFMAATFTETLQFHYAAANPALFDSLIDTFKPDYVFLTVVERAARAEWFKNSSPTEFTPGKQEKFIALSKGLQSGINDITKAKGTNEYRISGADPFVTFVLATPVRAHDVTKLVFMLNCSEEKKPVKAQFFWHIIGSAFSEANSLRFVANPGITTVDLLRHSAWTQAGIIEGIRIDIESPSACPVLSINNIALGK